MLCNGCCKALTALSALPAPDALRVMPWERRRPPRTARRRPRTVAPRLCPLLTCCSDSVGATYAHPDSPIWKDILTCCLILAGRGRALRSANALGRLACVPFARAPQNRAGCLQRPRKTFTPVARVAQQLAVRTRRRDVVCRASPACKSGQSFRRGRLRILRQKLTN